MTQQPLFAPTSNWAPPEVLPDLSDAKIIAIDTETCDPGLKTKGPGAVRHDGYVVGISVATDTGYNGYFPFKHGDGGNLDRNRVVEWARKEFSRPHQKKVGANFLYDLEWLKATGIEVVGKKYDIQIAEPLLNEEKLSYSLNALAKEYLNETKDESLLIEAAKSYGVDPKGGLHHLHSKFVGPYAEADARQTLAIFNLQLPKIAANNLSSIFELETDITDLLLKMRFQGVRIDLEKASTASLQLERSATVQLRALYKLAGFEFNPWSNADLARACDKQSINYPRTMIGNPSFDNAFISTSQAPFLVALSSWRKLDRLRTVYIDQLILKHNHNGRIHAKFNQLRKDDSGTRTGRFSSENPNLQQIPARGVHAPLVRNLFIPEEGKYWAKLDYSQQEPRVLVHYAMTCKMESAQELGNQFINNPDMDFHQAVADMAGITRRDAKTINLGMMYGMGVNKLAAELNRNKEDAQTLFEQYHRRVPFVKELAIETSRAAMSRGFITTLLGRRRNFNLYEPSFKGTSYYTPAPLEKIKQELGDVPIQRAMVHKALNALIQGSSADMTKKAMLTVYNETGLVPHLQVHDELDYSVESEEQAHKIKALMETCVKLKVPIKADLTLGNSWTDI
jgi:DNA polymerase I-like protein with 3'-5' exonuclease and polymerase domains